ncbi:MAG: LysE family translocator [Bacteroidales bacterium]
MITITLGPAFFSLLQTSINQGFKAGMFMAIGISLSDIVIILLSYLGISRIISNPENQLMVGILGATILLIFGLVTFTKKPMRQIKKPEELAAGTHKDIYNPYTSVIKGFFLNIANPFLIIFWMGIMSYVTTNYGLEAKSVLSFFSGTMIIVFAADLTKSYVGDKVKEYIKPWLIGWLNRIVGIVLMASGVILISRVLYEIYPW